VIDTGQLVAIVTSLISIILLFVVIRLWASLRLDLFRQEMFALRDRMFDYAMDGNIDFSHPAYRLLRKSMNGFIRYAHNLTFYRLTVTMLQWRVLSHRPELKWAEEWNKALEEIPNEAVRRDLITFHTQSATLVAKRIVLGSPVLVLLLIVVAAQLGLKSLTEAAVKSLTEFIDPRVLEEEAARVAA
jgi:hypothetical protein